VRSFNACVVLLLASVFSVIHPGCIGVTTQHLLASHHFFSDILLLQSLDIHVQSTARLLMVFSDLGENKKQLGCKGYNVFHLTDTGGCVD
jgi:hypothetical protein